MNALISLVAAVALTGPQANFADASHVRLGSCLVSLIDHAEVPAREAGQLMSVEATEGQSVEKGDFLAQIDDTLAQMEKYVAEKEQAISEEEANSDINIQFSEKSEGVARSEYEKGIEANKRSTNTVTHSELMKRWFEWERAKLSIEKAKQDKKIARLTADAREAQVEATEAKIQMRKITAPIGGVVVRLYKKTGEWVSPGDEVFRIIRMDRLRVEGLVDADAHGPAEFRSRPVSVEVRLPHGRVETFQGKVTVVHPEIEEGNSRRIWAEVVNRKEHDEWILQPGMHAEMTVDLSAAPVGADGTARANLDNVR